MEARPHGVHRHAHAPRDHAGRQVLVEAEPHGGAVRLFQRQDGLGDHAAYLLALHHVRGGWQGLAPRRGLLAKPAPPRDPAEVERHVPYDPREIRRERPGLCGRPLDPARNFAVVERSGIPIESLVDDAGQVRLQELLLSSGTIVDALLGTGATGDPRPPLDAVIGELNRSGLSIVAVDLPSGLDCDTGKAAAQTIRATHTCTFVAMKPGLLVAGAEGYTGQVHVVSIGAPRRLIEESFATDAT